MRRARHSMMGESVSDSATPPATCSFSVVDQPRFAQARLADQQHDLTHPLVGLLPAIREEAHLMVATGQRRESGRCRRFDQAAGRGDPLDAKQADRLGHPLDFLCTQVRRSENGRGTAAAFLRCRRRGRARRRRPGAGPRFALRRRANRESLASTTAGPVWMPTQA